MCFCVSQTLRGALIALTRCRRRAARQGGVQANAQEKEQREVGSGVSMSPASLLCSLVSRTIPLVWTTNSISVFEDLLMDNGTGHSTNFYSCPSPFFPPVLLSQCRDGNCDPLAEFQADSNASSLLSSDSPCCADPATRPSSASYPAVVGETVRCRIKINLLRIHFQSLAAREST